MKLKIIKLKSVSNKWKLNPWDKILSAPSDGLMMQKIGGGQIVESRN
jgi:hypothetical protein